MKYTQFFILVLVMTLAVGCQSKGESSSGDSPPADTLSVASSSSSAPALVLAFEQEQFLRRSASCEQDSNYCARVEATYPVAVDGPESVVKRINDTLNYYLRISLAVFAPTLEDIPASLEDVANDFLEEYEVILSEEGEMAEAWSVDLDGAILYQSEKIVSAQFSIYSYAGGAHPNSFVYLINFDARTGEVLQLTDLASDTTQLKEIAEIAFREARELASEESLSEAGFFWDGSFALPENYALTEEGLLFFYNPYEIAAYAYGPTEFTISREQLAGILKEF